MEDFLEILESFMKAHGIESYFVVVTDGVTTAHDAKGGELKMVIVENRQDAEVRFEPDVLTKH